MGRTIAVASQKGGVGKTTTVLNLGFSLSRLGSKTLLVDGDPQGGLGLATNVKKKARGGLVDVLRGRIAPEQAVTVTRDGMMAVVGVGALDGDDVPFIEGQAASGALAHLVGELARGFDYTLIDSPGGVGGLVRGLLGAAGSVLATVSCKALAVRSLPTLLKTFQALGAGKARPPRFEGLVVTMLNRGSATERALWERLKQSMPTGTLFETVVPHDERFEEASFRAIPVAMLPGATEAARTYMDLAMELKAREAAGSEGEKDGESPVGLF